VGIFSSNIKETIMATADKIKMLKEKIKEAKAVEKEARSTKNEYEKQFKGEQDVESSKLFIDAARTWAKSVVNISKLTDKLENLSQDLAA
jgi:hypothetical protein